MALTRIVHLANLSPEYLLVSLFTDVSNAGFLRQQLLDGNTEFEYAFIDASTIISTTHVLAAAFRALNDLRGGRLRTRNVHSEIVFSLGASNNIADSFRRFGVSEATRHVLAIKVECTPSSTSQRPSSLGFTAESVSKHLSTHVVGTPILFNDASIRCMTDWAYVGKSYRLGPTNVAKRKGGGIQATHPADEDSARMTDDEIKKAEAVVLGTMALKGS